jgi:hypothetical protein
MSSAFYQKLSSKQRGDLNAWSWAGIRCADNAVAMPAGWTVITVNVGPSTINIPVCVLESLPVDVLLGVDWLRASRAIIFWDELILAFRGKLGSVAISATVKPVNTSPLTATIPTPVNIPPYSEMFVEVCVDRSYDYIPEDQTYSVEGSARLRDEKAIMIGQGYVNIKKGKLNLLVSNWSNAPVHLKRGEAIATLNPEDAATPILYIDPNSENSAEEIKEMPLDEIVKKVEALMKSMKIELENYDEKYHKRIVGLLYKYRNVFSDKPGRCTLIQHSINTGDHPPILCQAYREPYKVKPIIQEIIKGMMDDGLV